MSSPPPAPPFAWMEFLPESVRGFLDGPAGVAVLVLVGAVAVYVLARVAGAVWKGLFGTAARTADDKLAEKLADYPPPPGKPGPRRLTVEGVPVRVRLVVVAPVARGDPVETEDVEFLADEVVRGMKDLIGEDRPRVRVWPAQLSRQGFAPTFHRVTEKPEAEGRPSRWILVAGPASAGRKPILLGLALWADTPNTLGRITLDAGRWAEVLRVQAQPA